MSDDLSGDMLAPSWPNLVKIIAMVHSKCRRFENNHNSYWILVIAQKYTLHFQHKSLFICATLKFDEIDKI